MKKNIFSALVMLTICSTSFALRKGDKIDCDLKNNESLVIEYINKNEAVMTLKLKDQPEKTYPGQVKYRITSQKPSGGYEVTTSKFVFESKNIDLTMTYKGNSKVPYMSFPDFKGKMTVENLFRSQFPMESGTYNASCAVLDFDL